MHTCSPLGRGPVHDSSPRVLIFSLFRETNPFLLSIFAANKRIPWSQRFSQCTG
jgi:hypothetical protein